MKVFRGYLTYLFTLLSNTWDFDHVITLHPQIHSREEDLRTEILYSLDLTLGPPANGFPIPLETSETITSGFSPLNVPSRFMMDSCVLYPYPRVSQSCLENEAQADAPEPGCLNFQSLRKRSTTCRGREKACSRLLIVVKGSFMYGTQL